MANHARTTTVVALAIIVALSIVQLTALAPGFVYGENLSVTASQPISTASNVTQPVIQITPSMESVTAGDYARFDINIIQPGTANVQLIARDVPTDSNAIFAPQVGVANPQFHSTLVIVTSADTPSGNYNVTVVALLNGEEYSTYVDLQLSSNTTATQTSAITPTSSLSLSVGTDLHSYESNSTVTISGQLTDASGNAIPDASVSVQVDDPTGTQLILVNNLTTDSAGIYHMEVKLDPNAAIGTYTVFASSFKPGYSGVTTHTTFVVGSSLTPSVVISQVYITDATGNPSGVFSVGQTLFVWVTVQNNGAQFQGVIWVQILDPNGTPQSIQLKISTLPTAASVNIGFSFTASANLPRGIYAVNALVSDNLISQGGIFLASAKAQFALTG